MKTERISFKLIEHDGKPLTGPAEYHERKFSTEELAREFILELDPSCEQNWVLRVYSDDGRAEVGWYS